MWWCYLWNQPYDILLQEYTQGISVDISRFYWQFEEDRIRIRLLWPTWCWYWHARSWSGVVHGEVSYWYHQYIHENIPEIIYYWEGKWFVTSHGWNELSGVYLYTNGWFLQTSTKYSHDHPNNNRTQVMSFREFI